MCGRKLSRWITKQWDKSKRQLVLKLDSAINELISKHVVTIIELKDSDVHKMPRKKTVINILMVSTACGFCCTLILIFYFGWLFSLWFTCLMLALIKESVYTAVLCYCSLVRIRQSLLFSLVMCGRHDLKHVVSYRSMHLTQTNTQKAFKLPASSLRFTKLFSQHPTCVILEVNHRKCQ